MSNNDKLALALLESAKGAIRITQLDESGQTVGSMSLFAGLETKAITLADMTAEASHAAIESNRFRYAVPAMERTKQEQEKTKQAAEDAQRAIREAEEETKRATTHAREETSRSRHRVYTDAMSFVPATIGVLVVLAMAALKVTDPVLIGAVLTLAGGGSFASYRLVSKERARERSLPPASDNGDDQRT